MSNDLVLAVRQPSADDERKDAVDKGKKSRSRGSESVTNEEEEDTWT